MSTTEQGSVTGVGARRDGGHSREEAPGGGSGAIPTEEEIPRENGAKGPNEAAKDGELHR